MDATTITLTAAIQAITADYDWEIEQTHDTLLAVDDTRTLLNHDEIDYWKLEDANLAASYHLVLDASEDDLTQALRAMGALAD